MTAKKEKEIKKVEPNTPSWKKKAFNLMLGFIGGIHACNTCGNPTIPGYCCTFCGESNP